MKQMEMTEGPEAFARFTAAMKTALSTPHSLVQQRIAEHKAQSNASPRKRGPKPQKKESK